VSVLGRFARDRKEFFSYLMPGELLAQDVLSGSVTLVDVRSEDQRRETPPIPGSLLHSTLRELKKLPRNAHIVLMCEDGYLANLYSLRLRQSGWTDVKSLLGGYKRWRQYHRNEFYYHIK
ncbi:MAG TPA: rhodanese-like domain-containing protein, partial [Bacteroidota bacterium]|nr:rhodanese-like domain-containing protein [Bacteroidota bacterium]